jgi:1-aminocyclopropane-1-carboxylate deaminase
MNFPDTSVATIDKIRPPWLKNDTIQLSVLRLDRIHPIISGNKWFKLKHYLNFAKTTEAKGMLTFGGAYSNHILATAAACRENALLSLGIIRGEEPLQYSFTLQQAAALGMQFHFISREAYASKQVPGTIDATGFVIVNEGGYGKPGAQGIESIFSQYDLSDFTHIICAVGTGTTLAGLVNGSKPIQAIIGTSTMKNNQSLEAETRELLTDKHKPFTIFHDYHFGGYAKHSPELIEFMNGFYSLTGIPTDFVYTGKMFYAIRDLATKDFFPSGSRVLAVHSGGLQGNASLPKGTLIF